MKAERLAWFFVISVVIGLPLAAVVARSNSDAIEIHAQMADTGGWTPSDLTAQVNQPLRLKLTSDDVMHGFAVGQSSQPAIDVLPGQWTTTTLTFDRPGKYTFYCTRWCGPNHWRMRGTIEVTGDVTDTAPITPPLYVTLNLDLDAPHSSDVVPGERSSATRGAALGRAGAVKIDRAWEAAESPAQVWQQLRSSSITQGLSNDQVWDLVAWQWRSNTTPGRLAEGQRLYAQNCAACHGETGKGDGVIAPSLQKTPMPGMNMRGHETIAPIDFTDAKNMLGASEAILAGKIVRGGMGTGMPYWGPIFTDKQVQTVIDYLWTFQFDE
jgi:mono/diheme cytochrome c family protein